MKILVAPNAYKECASSTVAAEFIASELKLCGYNDAVRFPLSDGGDGFLEVCARLSQLQIRSFLIRNCHNDLTRRVRVGFDKKKQTFYIESAEVIGLKTIPRHQRNPLRLSTDNLGELLNISAKLGDRSFESAMLQLVSVEQGRAIWVSVSVEHLV